jgi:dihydropteroate synthase
MQVAFRYAPTHEEVVAFAKEISENYEIFPRIIESELNREVLMGVSRKSIDQVAIDFESEL